MTFSAKSLPFHFPEESDDESFFGEDNNLLMLSQPLIFTQHQSVDQLINLEDKHSDWVEYCASISSETSYARKVTDFYEWRRKLINQGNLLHLDIQLYFKERHSLKKDDGTPLLVATTFRSLFSVFAR